MIIKTNDVAANTITTSIRPSDILYTEIYDADYETTSGNRVIDIKEPAWGFLVVTDYANAINAGGNAEGRSSIRYGGSNTEINLFFPMTTGYKQTCCATDAAADKLCSANNANTATTCTTGLITAVADSIILKIIANSNALTLKSSDNDSTGTGTYMGVELVPGSGSAKGMFGMFEMVDVTAAVELCLNALNTTATTRRICSTYSNYVTYTEA